MFCQAWGEDAAWESRYMGGPHEANFLKLDCSKIKQTFRWMPRMGVKDAIAWTVEWTKEYLAGAEMLEVMDWQIKEFFE